MDAAKPTERTRVKRKPARGVYEREAIYRILDETLTCHIGFAVDGQPYVTPTVHARDGERLYFHGSPANRMLRMLATGVPCCVTVTQVDGIVLARTARKHSLNYRSVMILGIAEEVTDHAEKAAALQTIIEHMVPGRSGDVEAPKEDDLDSTSILSLPITEASAKIREGGPSEALTDDLDTWAGQLPITIVPMTPIPDPALPGDIPVPGYLRDWQRSQSK